MLDIPDWTIENLVEALSTGSETIMQWLAEKSVEWHQRLYVLLGDFLSNAPSRPSRIATDRKSKLSSLCIIPCSDGTYRVGSECYFPSDGVARDDVFPRVVQNVYSSGQNKAEQEKAHKFLENIGVREVGEADRIETILKQRYSQTAVDKGNFRPEIKDVKRFMALLEKCPSQAELFGNYFIFKSDNDKWRKPSQVYLDSPYLDTGLNAYYDALDEESNRRRALSANYQKSGLESERLVKFAKAVGAQTKLAPEEKKISYGHPLWFPEMWDGRRWSEYGINKDYDMPEFETLLAKPDASKSRLIWDTMNDMPECCLIATVCLSLSSPTYTGCSSLINSLREVKWVPQQQDVQSDIHFLKPTESDPDLLPKGFSYEPQAQWLEAIEFGKSKREREEAERRREQQSTHDYQGKNDAAKNLGFSSAEEAEEMAKISREDPEFIARWKAEKQKPKFPEKTSQNPERRRKQLAEQYANAPQKKYEKRSRSVRTSQSSVDPDRYPYLKDQYTDDSDQMICQICKDEMPFKKRDGDYYFEAVEALSGDYFPKEHVVQCLALCPLCAAMYQEFVKHDEEQEAKLYHALQNAEGLEVPVKLGECETSVRFVERHWRDMRTILQLYQE